MPFQATSVSQVTEQPTAPGVDKGPPDNSQIPSQGESNFKLDGLFALSFGTDISTHREQFCYSDRTNCAFKV